MAMMHIFCADNQTVEFCKTLQASGFSQEQAEAIVEQQQKAINEVFNAKELAAKADIATLRMDMRELATKNELIEMKISLIKWIAGSMLSLAAFLAAVVFGIFAILPQLANFMRG